jgi:hypothetical protein
VTNAGIVVVVVVGGNEATTTCGVGAVACALLKPKAIKPAKTKVIETVNIL